MSQIPLPEYYPRNIRQLSQRACVVSLDHSFYVDPSSSVIMFATTCSVYTLHAHLLRHIHRSRATVYAQSFFVVMRFVPALLLRPICLTVMWHVWLEDNGSRIMPLNSPGGSTLQWGVASFAVTDTSSLFLARVITQVFKCT